MSQSLRRTRLHMKQDPNSLLAQRLGPAFVSYRRDFAAAEAGRRPEYPLHLDVDVTTACNFRCPMCPAGAAGHNFPGLTKGLRLPRALYSRALAEGRAFGLPSVRLGLTGEPSLVEDIDAWVAEAAAAGVIDISLITNGSRLTAELSRRLIEAGLTRLMISVDAASSETYSRLRPGGSWGILLKNIETFLSLRAKAASVLPLLRLSFVETNANQAEAEAFVERFSPLADYLSLQRYQNIVGGSSGLKAPAGRAPAEEGFCAEPFTRLALHADGGLFPCCSDFGRRRPLGNLASASLVEIWNSAEARFLCTEAAKDSQPCALCLAAGR